MIYTELLGLPSLNSINALRPSSRLERVTHMFFTYFVVPADSQIAPELIGKYTSLQVWHISDIWKKKYHL